MIKLLEDSYITYYWIGFLLADGNFEKRGRLRLTLSIQDLNHLEKFANYFNINTPIRIINNKTAAGIQKMKADIIKPLIDKFGIDENKTKNPPNIDIFKSIDKDLLYALIIGFIDGDGCIRYQTGRKDTAITIKLDPAWLDFLNLISTFLLNKNISKINNAGYASLVISNSIAIKRLKQKAIDFNLPILSRKWEKIDMSFISRQEQAIINRNNVLKLKNEGKSINEISEILNLKYNCIYQILSRNKNK
jgi:hypothetical protein